MVGSGVLRVIGMLAIGWSIDRTVAAQSTAPPAFEAASIKANISGDSRSGTRTMTGGRIVITNLTLRQIIRTAYGSEDMEVIGGPDWMGTDRWDIVATAGSGDADPPWRMMLISLLAERFKLVAHTESRDRPIFALVVARSDKQLGPSIHPSERDVDCRGNGGCGSTQANTSGIASGVLTGTSRTMADIAQSVSRYAERQVFDRTRLQGRYDYELRWLDVSIFTAIQEQLGLKLESTRDMVDVVLIDRVEKASEN